MICCGNKINTITIIYTPNIGFQVSKTNIKVRKIDRSSLTIYVIVMAAFLYLNKCIFLLFFLVTLLLAMIYIDIILEIHFLACSNKIIDFANQKYISRFYIFFQFCQLPNSLKL